MSEVGCQTACVGILVLESRVPESRFRFLPGGLVSPHQNVTPKRPSNYTAKNSSSVSTLTADKFRPTQYANTSDMNNRYYSITPDAYPNRYPNSQHQFDFGRLVLIRGTIERLQPASFRALSSLGQLCVISDRPVALIDIGVNGLRRLAIAAVENGLRGLHGDAFVI